MIILASQSPRRKQLMEEDITSSFKIVVSDIDESVPDSFTPLEAVMDIAKRKGEKVSNLYPDDIVISADTICVIDNQIIGKPKDKDDANRLLKLLSNRTHIVYTSYFIKSKTITIHRYVKSYVTFNELSEKLISDYIATGSPLDKAGAYGFQDNEKFPIVKSIEGSIKNVIGFPTDEIKKDLEGLI